MDTPKTLQDAIIHYSNPDNCIAFLVLQRWSDGVVKCPTCGREGAKYLPTRRVWQCKSRHPKSQFSIKVGTIFEDSALGLDKWLAAMWLVANSKNGISSHEVARSLGITQKSAWHMTHRIRLAMKNEAPQRTMGQSGKPVEVDETFIGGKPQNMHYKRRLTIASKGERKAVVMGMFDRHAREVRAKVVPNAKRETLQNEILANIVKVGTVYTDGHVGYSNLPQLRYIHETVNHLNEYVRGDVHTNCIENFWSLLKRSLNGTYVAVEPFHLERYVDEQAFRFNNRKKMTDGDRFALATSQILGKRLTYADLTGKKPVEAF